MAEHFLTKTRIDLGRCIRFGDESAIEKYPDLVAYLAELAGPDAARLFAEPLVSKGNDQAAATVSWYVDRIGQGTPLNKLDEAAREEVGAVLSQQLLTLKPFLEDREAGPLLAAALHITGPSDIQVVGGYPVLINWGMLPEGAARDLSARTAQYQRTLGPYLPLHAAPPLTSSEQDNTRVERSAAAASVATAAAASAAFSAASAAEASVGAQSAAETIESKTTSEEASAVPVGDPAPELLSRQPVPVWMWLPLVVLLLVVGGALAWLLVPGNRIFSSDLLPPRAVSDADALRLAEDVNTALEARLSVLNDAVQGAVCRADGTLLMPDGATIEGMMPPGLQDSVDRSGEIVQTKQTPVLPPEPARVLVTGLKGETTLLQHVDARTAMVLVSGGTGPDAGDNTSGTGFFIEPDLLVTSFQVVGDAPDDRIFVTSKSLGGLKEVSVLKRIGPLDQVGADFALLRVKGAEQPYFSLQGDSQSIELHSIIAAGYPGNILRTDGAFADLLQGDATDVPDLVITDGTVGTQQSPAQGITAIVHSAPMFIGNAGGPLVDMCGRVVGVNASVQSGPLRNLNLALATEDLLKFLDDTPARPDTMAEDCQPMVARPGVTADR